jgi:hypothetical protein
MTIKRPLAWIIISIGALWGVYGIIMQYLILSNNTVTMGVRGLMHGGNAIFILHVGMIAIIIAACLNSPKVIISSVLGYAVGFILAVFLNFSSPDPTGAMVYNNAAHIWMYTLLSVLAAVTLWEIIGRKVLQKK